jgi:hypothetical protein
LLSALLDGGHYIGQVPDKLDIVSIGTECGYE